MKVLVTDGDTRASLAITRSLGASGHEVWVGGDSERTIASVSRYCGGAVRLAGRAEGPEALGRSLVRAVRSIEPAMVVGVADATIEVLHHRATDLLPAALPPPSASAYFAASDKVALFRSCRTLGIPVPEGIVAEGGAVPAPDALQALGSPLVVRPARSWRVAQGTWIRGSVSYEPSARALAARVAIDEALRFPYLIQRRVSGEGCGLFLLADDGTIRRLFAHRRLREKPPEGGVSTLCVSVRPPTDLVDLSARWAAASRWSGVAMLEFKRDATTGQPYLLEVNARPWGSMALPIAAGVDFPGEWIGGRPAAIDGSGSEYADGMRMRWWWGDVDHFLIRGKGRAGSRGMRLLRAMGSAVVSGPWPETWDTVRRDDPVPFLLESLLWTRR